MKNKVLKRILFIALAVLLLVAVILVALSPLWLKDDHMSASAANSTAAESLWDDSVRTSYVLYRTSDAGGWVNLVSSDLPYGPNAYDTFVFYWRPASSSTSPGATLLGPLIRVGGADYPAKTFTVLSCNANYPHVVNLTQYNFNDSDGAIFDQYYATFNHIPQINIPAGSVSYDIVIYGVFFKSGYDFAYDGGVSTGYDSGHEAGYQTGYDEGYQEGINSNEASSNSYNQGYNAGYSVGLAKGQATTWENLNVVGLFLAPVNSFLSTPIFGSFSIGTAFSVVLVVLLGAIFIKMFAGG